MIGVRLAGYCIIELARASAVKSAVKSAQVSVTSAKSFTIKIQVFKHGKAGHPLDNEYSER